MSPLPTARPTDIFTVPESPLIVTSDYCERRLQRGRDFHEGIDFQARMPISVSAMDGGTVLFAGPRSRGFGTRVVVDYPRHLSQLRGVLRAGLRPLVVVALGAAASACAQPASPGQPAAPAASSADVSTAEAPAPSAGSGAPELCFPPVAEGGEWQGSPWTETARATDGADTYVLAEPASSGATAGFDPALLRLRGDACEASLVYETDSESGTDVRAPDAVWETLYDGSFAWHVREAGGVEAYAALQIEAGGEAAGGVLAECSPDDDLGPCLQMWLADRFRDAGVEVGTL